MNKLSIWTIAITGAFVIGVLSANPVVEAVGGWQPVVDGLDARITTLEGQAGFNSYWTSFTSPSADSAMVLCQPGEKVIAGSAEGGGGRPDALRESRPIFDQGANFDQEGWSGRFQGGEGFRAKVWAHCLIP